MYSKTLNQSLRLFAILIAILVSFSCGNKKSIEEAQKVINESTPQTLLQELKKVTKDDNALSRMLEITPSVISRIIDGKTKPTEALQKKIQDVYEHYYCSGSIIDTRSTFDPKSKSFFKRMWLSAKYHPIWYIISCIFSVVCIFILFAYDLKILGFLCLISLIINIILSLTINSSSVQDPFTDKIDVNNEVSVINNTVSTNRTNYPLFNITETQKIA